MRWQCSHEFDAPIARVEAIATGADTLAHVPRYMSLIAHASRVEVITLDAVRTVNVDRFKPSIEPPAFARARVTREMLEWAQRMTWDADAHAGTYVIEPNLPPEWRHYFFGEGRYRLEALGETRTVRHVDGVFEVRVPIVGAIAERFAVPELRRQFDGEARMITALLAM
jgi:hypothetical protein